MRAIAEIDPANSRRVGYREDNHLDLLDLGPAVVPNQPFCAVDPPWRSVYRFRGLPACSTCLEALVCAQKLKVEIDLLIVNPLQAGVADFINTLRRSQGTVKVLALSDQQTVDLSVVNASLGKPGQLDQNNCIRWLYAVEQLLAAN
jgi:hypothetical protein